MNHHAVAKAKLAAAEHAAAAKTQFGFWVYLMTDCVLFASLFAVYAVLQNNTAYGPGSQGLFDLNFVLIETVLLLTSSFVCGMAVLAAANRNRRAVIQFLAITCLLGAAFLGMELYEFSHLIHEGNGPQTSAFLSAFFTLVGTHGLHILAGLIWGLTLMAQITRGGLTHSAVKRLGLFSLFWHFLDVVWIFIFTVVYMIGSL